MERAPRPAARTWTSPSATRAAQLLVEVDGADDAAVDADAARRRGPPRRGALDVAIADDAREARALWRLRRSLGEAVKKVAAFIECDTAVPPSKVPDLLRGVREVAAALRHPPDLATATPATATSTSTSSSTPRPRRRGDTLRPAIEAIFDVATRLGGTITGEHGVGCVSRYLAQCRDPVAIAAMRAVKEALDPQGILNPGRWL